MRQLRPSFVKILLLVLVACLFSSVVVTAAPIPSDYRPCGAKVQLGVESRGCCQEPQKPADNSFNYGGCCQQPEKPASNSVNYGGCCQQAPKVGSKSLYQGGCCQQAGKVGS